MADTYPNFATLEQHERAGIDYAVLVRREEPAFAIIAPHGGGIEPGTSEIADAIACQRWSFYAFEGLKRTGNRVLHLTSTCFDEPMCLVLLGNTNRVVTIHGEESDDDGEGVFVGGLDDDLGTSIGACLTAEGFNVRKHPGPQPAGARPSEHLQQRRGRRRCPAGAVASRARDAVRITHTRGAKTSDSAIQGLRRRGRAVSRAGVNAITEAHESSTNPRHHQEQRR